MRYIWNPISLQSPIKVVVNLPPWLRIWNLSGTTWRLVDTWDGRTGGWSLLLRRQCHQFLQGKNTTTKLERVFRGTLRYYRNIWDQMGRNNDLAVCTNYHLRLFSGLLRTITWKILYGQTHTIYYTIYIKTVFFVF